MNGSELAGGELAPGLDARTWFRVTLHRGPLLVDSVREAALAYGLADDACALAILELGIGARPIPGEEAEENPRLVMFLPCRWDWASILTAEIDMIEQAEEGWFQ